jgi:hypothetical protein
MKTYEAGESVGTASIDHESIDSPRELASIGIPRQRASIGIPRKRASIGIPRKRATIDKRPSIDHEIVCGASNGSGF